jgi:hypothetical protein
MMALTVGSNGDFYPPIEVEKKRKPGASPLGLIRLPNSEITENKKTQPKPS